MTAALLPFNRLVRAQWAEDAANVERRQHGCPKETGLSCCADGRARPEQGDIHGDLALAPAFAGAFDKALAAIRDKGTRAALQRVVES